MKIEQPLTKLYYSIGEVAELFQVAPSLIRYWETVFPTLKPKKNRKGDRRYMVKDIHELEQIYTLVKERGFTLEGAREELKNKNHPNQLEELKQKLFSIRKKLEDLRGKL